MLHILEGKKGKLWFPLMTYPGVRFALVFPFMPYPLHEREREREGDYIYAA